MEMKQAMMMVESGIAPKLPTVVSSVSMSWVSVTSPEDESRCRVVKSLYIECVSAETFSREEQPDDGRSRASPRVARRRSERFWGATCRRPDRGSVSQGRVSCFTNKHFVSDAVLNVFTFQLRSYSRHDLLIDPFEDTLSEIRFRKQRVEMERRVSPTVVLIAGVRTEEVNNLM